MLNLRREVRIGIVGVLIGASALVMASCSKEEEAPPQQAYTPPPPPPPDPMENLKIDPRVQFPPDRGPSTHELAQAIATLASALAKGDANAAKSVLAPEAGELIDSMVESGDWETGTKGIETVRVCVLSEQTDSQIATVGLGIQDADGAYMLAWRGSTATGEWEFEPMPLNDTEATQVAMLDGSPLLSRTLPGPESVSVDPESRKVKVRKRFSRNGSE